MKETWKIGVIIGFVGVGVFMAHQTRFLECVSESLKGVRYILVWRGSDVCIGDVIFIKNHKIKTISPQVHHQGKAPMRFEGRSPIGLEDKPLNFAKRVLGFPGDLISRNKDILSIGSYRLPLLKQTKDGKPLTPLSILQVPQGHVFVAGDHPRSFDSRYEEFGCVPFSKIWGKGVASW